jgi:hypothetical protein
MLAFSGGFNATEAANIVEYGLTEAATKGSFTAQKPIRSRPDNCL